MSKLTDKYSKNFSPEKKKEFERRVRELDGLMSEESAIDLILKELFKEKFKKGGFVDKPLGAGGKKSGPPPKRGPNPQGLNIKNNTVKTVKLEK
jgi:hypothetical protein|tara:strand:+ start:156 stop:437 length:282 start_codon:yes stop_codon:yes gene_type:complete